MVVPWGAEGRERRRLEGTYRVFYFGRPSYARSPLSLNHDDVEAGMDPRDLGVGCEAKELKAQHDLPAPGGPRANPIVLSLAWPDHKLTAEQIRALLPRCTATPRPALAAAT